MLDFVTLCNSMVNTLCTYKLYQVVEFMFRQWTWNSDRICITATAKFYHILYHTELHSITLVPWPLSWTAIALKLDNFKAIRNQYFIKINIFWPGEPGKMTGKPPQRAEFSPTFEASTAMKGSQTLKTWPDLCNTTSWEAPHKGTATLDQSKRLKSPIYYTPVTVKERIQLKLKKTHHKGPSSLWTYSNL